jgi:hypothetical protein
MKDKTYIFFIRLLNYPNAMKVIKYADGVGGYANVVLGGIRIEATLDQWELIIEFVVQLGVRYELNKEHPSVTTDRIKDKLIAFSSKGKI